MPARLRLCILPNRLLLLASVLLFHGAARAETDIAAKPAPAARKKVDFVREIEPLLAKHCYQCHGPKKQESGLRLDRKADAMAGGDSGVVIVPNQGAESRLVHYISGVDPEAVMPPEGKLLSKKQVGLFQAWIDQGVQWPGSASRVSKIIHWAYQPLKRPKVPAPAAEAWTRNSIDAFVLAQLNRLEISPSPEADRHTLVRRLSLDLLGLPPTPQEVEQFLSDQSPNAYEKLVDRMLQSLHFGERWGRHWLDMARYADSDGYEKDRPRPNAWRWRDWVIEAINDDMPYDRFTVEQLAGDLLPNATVKQNLATAFHRQTLTNTEGGTDREQWRVEAVFDRVETVGTVWLGLTVGCARCHSHKYDQITQREYYQLFAFMNNGDEVNTSVPISQAADAKYKTDKAEYDRAVKNLQTQVAAARSAIGPALEEWETRIQAELKAAPQDPVKFHPLEIVKSDGPKGVELKRQDDGSYLAVGDGADKGEYTLTAKFDSKKITGFRLEVLADDSLPKNGPGLAGNGSFVLSEFRVDAAPSETFKSEHKVSLIHARSDVSQKDFPVAGAVDGNEKTGWAIGPQQGKNHHAVFITKRPIHFKGLAWLKLVLSQQHGKRHLIGRYRIMAMTGTDLDGIVPEEIRKLLAVTPGKRGQKQRDALAAYYAGIDPTVRRLAGQLDELKKKAPKLPNMSVRVIAQRTKDPRKTHVFRRGDFLQPMDEVQPNTLKVLLPLKPRNQEVPLDRLDFARWLTSTGNSLTPRVAANHLWAHLFGRGLVRTLNDFGVRGEKPMNPQLLDWLATEYVRLGWSRKAMIRQIVMSATYRQSSTHRPELMGVDPQNYLLSRQNRFRVEAEIIRDVALAAGGLLARRIGGPSVFPPMPADIAELSYSNNFKWKTSPGGNRYRRGMYTFFKRTAPHPNLTLFDCPTSNTTCVERNNSNTPLQALTTLNNKVFIETSQALAQRVLTNLDATDVDRIHDTFRLCVARLASATEQSKLLELLDAGRTWYKQHPEDAKKLVGPFQPEDLSPEEAAAWVATTRIIMNLDEFITRE